MTQAQFSDKIYGEFATLPNDVLLAAETLLIDGQVSNQSVNSLLLLLDSRYDGGYLPIEQLVTIAAQLTLTPILQIFSSGIYLSRMAEYYGQQLIRQATADIVDREVQQLFIKLLHKILNGIVRTVSDSVDDNNRLQLSTNSLVIILQRSLEYIMDNNTIQFDITITLGLVDQIDLMSQYFLKETMVTYTEALEQIVKRLRSFLLGVGLISNKWPHKSALVQIDPNIYNLGQMIVDVMDTSEEIDNICPSQLSTIVNS